MSFGCCVGRCRQCKHTVNADFVHTEMVHLQAEMQKQRQHTCSCSAHFTESTGLCCSGMPAASVPFHAQSPPGCLFECNCLSRLEYAHKVNHSCGIQINAAQLKDFLTNCRTTGMLHHQLCTNTAQLLPDSANAACTG